MHVLLVYVPDLNFIPSILCYCLKCDSLSKSLAILLLRLLPFAYFIHHIVLSRSCQHELFMNYATESIGLWMPRSSWRKQINPIGLAWSYFFSFWIIILINIKNLWGQWGFVFDNEKRTYVMYWILLWINVETDDLFYMTFSSCVLKKKNRN